MATPIRVIHLVSDTTFKGVRTARGGFLTLDEAMEYIEHMQSILGATTEWSIETRNLTE